MTFKNIKVVHPISEFNSLAVVDCYPSDLSHNNKYKTYFIDKGNKIVTYFEDADIFSAEQLVEDKENIFVLTFFGKNKKYHEIIKVVNENKILLNRYDDIEFGQEDGTFAVKKNNLWGFIDTDGNEIIAPQYEDYSAFRYGIAVVRKHCKRAYINKLGKNITPFKYWHCNSFYGGIAVAECFDDKTIDVIDKNGNILLKSDSNQHIFNLGNGSILIENKDLEFEIIKILN